MSDADDLQVDSNWFGKNQSEQQPYILLGAEETGREIRRGPFAIDFDVMYKGLNCIGKKVSCDDFEVDKEFYRRFDKQCSVLSELRHPHIVHFIGQRSSSGESRSPMIVTEYVSDTLTESIARYHPFPEEISHSILHDVSLALRYLHERVPPIAHRGLSASSVLLEKDMTAKLSDVGVMDILNLTPLQMMQRSRAALAYLPPEALDGTIQPQYITKIDIFSYGVLALHVFSGNVPMPDEVDSNQQSSEADLRKRFLFEMGDDHPLADLTRQCLSNSPESRPGAAEIQTKVGEVLNRFPRTPTSVVEMMQQIDSSLKTNQAQLAEIQDLCSSNKHKKEEIQQKEKMLTEVELKYSVGLKHDQLKLQELQAEIQSLKATLQSKEGEIRAATESAEDFKRKTEADCEQFICTREERWKTELHAREEECNERLTKAAENHKAILQAQQAKLDSELQENRLLLDTQLQRMDHLIQKTQDEKKFAESSFQAELSNKDKELQHKNAELQRKDAQLKKKDSDFEVERAAIKREHEMRLQAQLTSKDKELQHKNAELQRKDAQLKKKDADFEVERAAIKHEHEMRLQAQLTSKDKELQQKNAELQRKDAQLKQKEAYFDSEKDALKRKYNGHYEDQERDFDSQITKREREFNTKVREKDKLLEDKDAHIQKQVRQMQIKHDSELKEKETVIEATKADLSSREVLIDRKTEIIAGLHQQLDQLHSTVIAKSQVHPLNMHASFKWTQCTHLPIAMAHAQAVVVNGELYIGGGETDSDDTNCQLYKYIPTQERWSEAYPCPVRYFGLGKLSQQPVLVGGVDKESKQVSNTVYVFDDDASSQKHLRAIAPMPTARSHPCVVSHQSGLIVAGGYGERAPLTTVELFKDATQQWCKADPLPTPCAMLSSATIDDMCYLLGGEKPRKVVRGVSLYSEGLWSGKELVTTVSTCLILCAPIATLLKKAIPSDETAKPDPKTSIWEPMENTIHRHSAAVNLGEMLLAVAGDNSTMFGKDTKQAIYAYCPTSKNWLHITDLPEPHTMCTAVALPSQEILVIGGKDSNLKFSKIVYKGSIQT